MGIAQAFKEYISGLAKVKDDTEHSGRTALENLLNELSLNKSRRLTSSEASSEASDPEEVEVKHEPRRDKAGHGAPDFKFCGPGGLEIGYLENKKIGEDLDTVLASEQIEKYKNLTDNLIVTDYLRWIWIYQDEVVKDVRLCPETFLETFLKQREIKLSHKQLL